MFLLKKLYASKILLTDLGTNFTSNLLNEINTILNIQHTTTTANHPKTDRFAERFNRTLIDVIKIRKQKSN